MSTITAKTKVIDVIRFLKIRDL